MAICQSVLSFIQSIFFFIYGLDWRIIRKLANDEFASFLAMTFDEIALFIVMTFK